MPRKSKKGKNRVEVLCGSCSLNYSAATSANFPITPSNANWDSRANALADAFNLYRFTRITLKWCYPTTDSVVACLMGTTDTFPTTISNAIQCEYSAHGSLGQTTVSSLAIPRSFLLKTPAQWYKTEPGTPDPDFEVQGNIFVVTPSVATIRIFAEYEIEFSDWAPTGSTPMPSLNTRAAELATLLESRPELIDVLEKLIGKSAPEVGKILP